ncbi:MAG: hypothetical protein AABW61_00825 [Candidatus Aenigmatarchaeota archaeon]
MNAERKLALIYFVLGIAMGILSPYLNVMLSVGIGVVLYVISFFIAKKFTGENKKFSWYVLNTLLTFVLVWMVTWIFLFNL